MFSVGLIISEARRVRAVAQHADACSIHADVAEAVGSRAAFAAVAPAAAPPALLAAI
jgi:hypothetical protein